MIGISDTGCWKGQAPGVSTFEIQVLCLVIGFLFGGLICQLIKQCDVKDIIRVGDQGGNGYF